MKSRIINIFCKSVTSCIVQSSWSSTLSRLSAAMRSPQSTLGVFPHSLHWNLENKNDLLHITRIYTAVEFRVTRVRLDSGKVKGRKTMILSQSTFSDFRALKEKVTHALGRCCPAQQRHTSIISQHTLMGCGVETREKSFQGFQRNLLPTKCSKTSFFMVVGFVAQDQ